VTEQLEQALRALAATPTLLVALDFDGTLAPEVDDPERARATPEARDAVLRLADLQRTRVALVSGRAVDSLTRVADPPADVLLVGSHGIELRLDTADPVVDLDEGERERVEELATLLGGVAARYDGVRVEDKPAGRALHTRTATDADAEAARSAALEGAERMPGLTVRRGKNVLEFAVRSATKGDGVRRLRDHVGATGVLYAGDDVTDEDAFAVLGDGDLALKSGPGETAARHRVAGPDQVARALALLADARDELLRDDPR